MRLPGDGPPGQARADARWEQAGGGSDHGTAHGGFAAGEQRDVREDAGYVPPGGPDGGPVDVVDADLGTVLASVSGTGRGRRWKEESKNSI
jgi:hypothetical protein